MKVSRYKPVGWRQESYRHSLARRGIKTRNNNIMRNIKIGYAKPTPKMTPELQQKIFEAKSEINEIVYGDEKGNKKPDQVDKEVLSIVILRDKANYLDFLKGFTKIDVEGTWKNYPNEKNFQYDVEFLDSKDEYYGNRLMQLFNELNDNEIGEDVLYVRTVPVEESTLK